MTLVEFLLARIAEDEDDAKEAYYQGQAWISEEEAVVAADRDLDPILFLDRKCDARHAARWPPSRALAECEAKRRIVELHKAWPVLVETAPRFGRVGSDDLNHITLRASQQIQWLTEQEYRTKFGTEPPTAPMMQALAAIYADHPDYREEWKL